MGLHFRQYPNVLWGLTALGMSRLTELAERTGVSLKGVLKNPGAIAGALQKHIDSPDALRAHLTAADVDVLGKRFGIGTRATRTDKDDTSFEDAVLARFFEKHELPQEPALRTSMRDVSAASEWTELASLKKWTALTDAKRRKVAETLAQALGQHAKFGELVGKHKLARIHDQSLGLAFIAIPGGQFTMGLSDKEKLALARLVRKWEEEARMFARDIAEGARPAHRVRLAPFLCAESPITRAHSKLGHGAQVLGTHEVCLIEPANVIALATKTKTRLLSEAEWEFIARAGGARAWLADKMEFEAYADHVLAGDLSADDTHPFGVRGLGWGSWVEDGWHRSYRGAPNDGSAWEPREIAQVARSGALMSYPWQMEGEALLLHVAPREHVQERGYPVILARDLPARKSSRKTK